jgi:hypothetical protein
MIRTGCICFATRPREARVLCKLLGAYTEHNACAVRSARAQCKFILQSFDHASSAHHMALKLCMHARMCKQRCYVFQVLSAAADQPGQLCPSWAYVHHSDRGLRAQLEGAVGRFASSWSAALPPRNRLPCHHPMARRGRKEHPQNNLGGLLS